MASSKRNQIPTNVNLDEITAQVTAFNSFAELLATDENYRPTLMPRSWKETYVAAAFDGAMTVLGSPRRAWRG